MNEQKRQQIVQLLSKSYNMEIETVINYLANSVYLDGFKAKHVKDILAAEVQEELGHAQRLAHRIRVLEGTVPGSMHLEMTQGGLQPPDDPLDVIAVIEGVIQAEQGAIEQYQKIIDATEGVDPVTQDLCIELKGDEEEHRRTFKGFLAEAMALRT